MTLSVCCLTRDPGARVAAILGQLRAAADEIVVAVDARLDPGRLGRYDQFADRLLRYEFVNSCQQAVPWITSQCSGDWILLIDGDEVLSPALVERLPELTAARDVLQYWLPARWLYPDPGYYLAQPPWNFSSPRLVRNDPATLWHAGLSHGRFEPAFPAVHLEHGYYHLVLLVTGVEYRSAKLAHYLSIPSGHSRGVLEADLPAYYLPELDDRFLPAPVPVPERDRPAIEEVLSAAGEERPGPPPAAVPLWSWSEIERFWPRRALPDSAYRGAIELFERPPTLYGGHSRPLAVRVSNLGEERWPGLDREPLIKLSHRWRSPRGSAAEAWSETPIPGPLDPAASALLPVAITAPEGRGLHALELSLVHEDPLERRLLRRFATCSVPVDVAPGAHSPWRPPSLRARPHQARQLDPA